MISLKEKLDYGKEAPNLVSATADTSTFCFIIY